jgi:hypothetical protein
MTTPPSKHCQTFIFPIPNKAKKVSPSRRLTFGAKVYRRRNREPARSAGDPPCVSCVYLTSPVWSAALTLPLVWKIRKVSARPRSPPFFFHFIVVRPRPSNTAV